jgi:hypothetical protein
VPTDARQDVMAGVIDRLPEPADELFTVALHEQAVDVLFAELLAVDSEAPHG